MGFFNRIQNYFSSTKEGPLPSDAEALRLDFKERYNNFKLLISANNKALEIMADIERTLKGDKTFGMAYIKARCTAVSVNVFRMIRKMERLAPGKYEALPERYNAIQNEIGSILSESRTVRDDRLIIPLTDIHVELSDIVGGKMANLGELKNRIGMNVPDGFSITVAAYDLFLKDNDLQTEIDRRIQSATLENMENLVALSAEIRQLIVQGKMPSVLANEINEAVRQLSEKSDQPIYLALRSSALGEDASGASFAGQYHSILNVSTENIFSAYKEVLSSKYGVPALTYRLNRGFRDEDIAMSVACLCMVDAVSGGVAYTCNPVYPSDQSIFINAAWGLPKSVVDGSISSDLFVVSRTPEVNIIRSDIVHKERKFVCYPEEGVCRIDLTGEDTAAMPSLTPSQILKLAELALKIEAYYGSPQDIEWALSNETSAEFHILQCRPMQQMNPEDNPGRETIHLPDMPETAMASGGITASPGSASGPAYIAEKAADILGFPDNAVLFVRQALPQWAPLLGRAAAVVTEQGGFAGHLANVAREFSVPALFSLPGMLEKVETGMTVTVDADGLCVHHGRIESLLTNRKASHFLMLDSPVHRMLQRVSRHIVPLNLLDPDSPDFRPRMCTTLHDITRFIHEKSVQEMFNFGMNHHFPEKTAKQLYYKVPMQWWILNLDDGFHAEVKGKYVKIDNIASVPMLALWEGIIAVPWEGPPPIDGKGLLSVMFQATANPHLNTGTRSKYAERNYFMISRQYCSLSSRLGFHFSILETSVSERAAENYISFRFKGGAADQDRRTRRVRFLGELLAEFGFRSDIQSDHLHARLEGVDAGVITARLKMIGYLILHTRQLDMIMSKPAMVLRYHDKFRNDIEKIMNS
ncbi:MAG: pyruvate, water dikinase [Desulfobacteraceae bacterium]|nr:MAG: pyruvate, water dikinase [Desulfobacteraceae bacterium]